MNFLYIILLSLNFHKLTKPQEIPKTKGYTKLIKIMPEKDSFPEDSTLLYLGYTQNELVIYAKMWQKGKINASARKRDAEALAQSSEDAINILLTTQKERNTAYYISVNPLGTILDKIISTSGVTEWDADIKVKTEIKENFWSALILIPFKNLSFSESKWGIQIWRLIIEKLEIQALKPTTNLANPKEVIDFDIDFNYIKKPRGYSLFFIPSFRLERIPKNETKKSYFGKGGLTLRFKKGTSELFDFTYKPDFSEVDVDIIEASITRLPVNYPEKRPFFVEGFSMVTSPKTLIRTRNITYPNTGMKFYSLTDKSSFSVWYVNDDSLKDITFSRFTYSPFENMNFGVFLNINRMGYNIFSSDFSYYSKKLKTDFSFQYSRRLDLISELFDTQIRKEVVKGLGYYIVYREVDSSFISPLSYINLYFDGIRETYIAGNYKEFYKKKLYFNPSFYFSSMNIKYNNSLLKQEYGGNVVTGLIPFFTIIGYTNSKFEYLSTLVKKGIIKNTQVSIYSLGILYQISGWKQFMLVYTFGSYLGGKMKFPKLIIKFNFHGVNLGWKYFYFKSPLDDYYLLQFFGEVPLFLKNLIFKPYFGYKYDNLNTQAEITFNGIFAYQPSAFSGIFFAINKTLLKIGNKYINENEKEVFKIQIGIDIFR